ncbi:MAG: polysaccharide biosynthesis/export family protein [Alphaproteobacteria bacterium]|nr:polysaccharide biosynthesis/export family protein [Alphaproteobacteria bacterium]
MFFDEMPVEAQRDAGVRVVAALREGVDATRLAPGDVIEVLFLRSDRPTARSYRIRSGDELQLDFGFDPTFNRTVIVRPDGRIGVPVKGTVQAVGQTPEGLAASLRRLYADIMTNPQITVTLSPGAASSEDDLGQAIQSAAEGRSRKLAILSDGTVTLPGAGRVRAAGLTVAQLRESMAARYRERGIGFDPDVIMPEPTRERVFVFGEVPRPGQVPAGGPYTTLLAVAAAGGVMPTGAIDGVRVVYVGADSTMRVRTVNLLNILERAQMHEELILPPNSVVYVPPTQLARTGRLVDQVLRQILMFNGVGVGFTYELNRSAR